MAKKLKKKVQRKPAVRKAENPVVDSAREIWLAGLGAFSVAQQEGEKILDEGNKFFDKLVKEGSKVEKRTRKDVESAFDGIRGEVETRVKDFRGEVETRVKDIRGEVETRVKDIRGEVESRVKDMGGDIDNRLEGVRGQADSVRKQASTNWDKLEGIFDERVSRVLARLGIPTRDDINTLSKRVQELSRKVAMLDKKSGTTRRAPAKPKAAAAKKAAPKKTVARKAAPKKAAPKKTVAKKVEVKKTEAPTAAPKAA